ncbi:hypothetical protein [Mycolicibacterium lacusdiani]|uniref:hypothetical protein n=1 Tax=Mycolicibacterium lacusdiani TaxID=2895283 RepID=UPI001F29ED59|nr:hypothetical protein [Mycolicibacterium lacusdiani]
MRILTTGQLKAIGLAAAVSGSFGIVALAGTVPASAATDDPGCEAFGWRHPMCAGGAWANDETASEEWGPANIPNPVTPGGDMSMTFPGSPNTP